MNEQEFWSVYKQATQKLREENARLKEEIEELKYDIQHLENTTFYDKYINLRQVLEEIRNRLSDNIAHNIDRQIIDESLKGEKR